MSIAVSGDTEYLGGSFTHIGPTSSFAPGHFVALDAATGQAHGGRASVYGTVYAAAQDGSGGWYLGGDLHSVSDAARRYLVHINANGTLNAWDPNPDDIVTAISSPSADGKVYIGGFFTHVNSAERSHLAAVDGLTGALTSFDPNVDGTVEAISVNGPTVYAGGVFATVNGSLTRNGLAAFDATTGTATSFDPNLQFGPEAGESWSLLMVGSTLYAGGLFTTVNGSTPRNSLAAFDAPTGSVTSFDPNVRKGPGLGIVNDLALAGTTLYFGGSFDTVNGTTARNAVAAVDTTTGAVTSFDPNITGALGVAFDLALAGSDLYVAGEFSKVNGNTARTSLAAFDRNTGVATGFNPDLHPQEGNFEVDVYTVGVNGDEAFAGGRFVSAGGVARNHLAAIYLPTGQPTSFDPNVSGPVEALAVKGPLLYAGGAFATVNGGNVRSYLAAFDASTGTTTNFHPVIDGIVDAIAVSGATVYAGGAFRNAFVGGGLTRRNHLAAFDAASGAPTGFDPDVNGDVTALAVSGSTVYAGGDFTAVNGASPRNRLAAFDASTGSATSFDPNVNDTVLSLAVDGATLYAGGFFTTVNGSATRNGLAAFNSATGVATAFDPNVNGVVVGVLLLGSSVYAGGGFRTANGATSRLNLASFDKASGQLRGWDPSPGGLVYALAQGDGMLLAGGAFSSLVAPGLVLTTPNLLALNGLARQPTNVTAAAGDGQAIVSFDAIAPAGDNPDLTYVVTASPGGQTATRTGSPITVTGLANGTTYTFRVQSSTEFGRSAPSAASNSVTPTGPASGGGTGGGGGGGGGGSGGGGGGGGGSYPDLQVALTASAATVPAVGSELDFFATVSMKNRATSRRDGSG